MLEGQSGLALVRAIGPQVLRRELARLVSLYRIRALTERAVWDAPLTNCPSRPLQLNA